MFVLEALNVHAWFSDTFNCCEWGMYSAQPIPGRPVRSSMPFLAHIPSFMHCPLAGHLFMSI